MSIVGTLLARARSALDAFGRPDPKPVPGQPPHEYAAPTAPWPLVDRYPTILGTNLSFQSIANAMRAAHTGYRQQLVDLLGEQLEREPHGFAVLSQRILAVAGGRLEILPAHTPEGDDVAKDEAETLAEDVGAIVRAIPDLRQSLASLLWALYYGVAGAEISWSREDIWRPVRLHMVHSRRLGYPDQNTWACHIWDQGSVRGYGDLLSAPTNGIFGLRVDDYPGKFIVHAPRLRGEYPTREGLGRELSYWFAIKALAARGASQYVERFAKPWPIATWSTSDTGNPRAANDDDIVKADAAMKALGIGSLAGATLPDSIKVNLYGPGQSGSAKAAIGHEALIALTNAEISKCVLGQTFTTEATKFGSKGTSDVGKSGTLQIATYDAGCLADTLKRDLVFWIVKLNWPEKIHLCPQVFIRVEAEPDAMELIDRAAKGAAAGMPVDADATADQVGLTLVPRADGDLTPRRMAPVKPATLGEIAASGRIDDADVEIDKASRIDLLQIPSATFKKQHKTALAHKLLPEADDATRSRIAQEIDDGVESETEMREILNEAQASAVESTDEGDGEEDDEGDETDEAAE
jgi:phage gp29-like protein